jgi:hypothetical protein
MFCGGWLACEWPHAVYLTGLFLPNRLFALNVTMFNSRVAFMTAETTFGSRRPSAKLLLSPRFLPDL